MFDSLSERLGRTIKTLRGQGRLTDDNIKDTMREVRMALLEADVALPVVKTFVERVRIKAEGQEVLGSLTSFLCLLRCFFFKPYLSIDRTIFLKSLPNRITMLLHSVFI